MIGYGLWVLTLLMAFTAHGMDCSSDDENVPPDLLGSWIIVRALEKPTGTTRPQDQAPLCNDLEILCNAAQHCSTTIHEQLAPLFKKCQLPLSEHDLSSTTYSHNQSVDDNILESLYVEDYACPFSYNREITFSRTPSPDGDESKGLLKSIITYPAYPLNALLKKITRAPSKKVLLSDTVLIERQPDACMINHAKYESVLKRATQLINAITDENTQKRTTLSELRKLLSHLQATTQVTLEKVESDRESFNVLLGCITNNDLTLSDNFLIQFCTMNQHNASLAHMLSDFGLQAEAVDKVTQEEFTERWQAIQNAYKTGNMEAKKFDALRQYTYVLQNATARFLTEQFIQGTINTYGMDEQLACKRGLTQDRIEGLTSELSNCKDFLNKLNRAFDQAIKTIDAKLS